MTRKHLSAHLKAYVDPVELIYGFFPAITGYAAFVSWLNLIVRAARGEPVREDWRVLSSTVAFITALTVTSGGRVRQAESLRTAAVEMRELVHDGSEDARRREEIANQRVSATRGGKTAFSSSRFGSSCSQR